MSSSEIFNWLSLHRMVVWPLLALTGLTVILMKWWEQARYFMLNVGYGLPWIGRVASFARKPQSLDFSRSVTWHASERKVCAAYYPHYRNLDDRSHPVFFEHCEDYLNKTGQLGRKEKGVLLWLATFALVILEAVGFAYVLAPFMARTVSANAAGMLAWMIAFMLPIILVQLTDKMGQQLHKNTLLKKIRVWHADARKNGNAEKLEPNTEIKIDTTHRDDDRPNYIKILNRVDAEARPTPGWKISFITVLAIAAIAVGACVVRNHALSGLEAGQVNASPFAASAAESSAAAFLFDSPDAAKSDNGKPDERTLSERTGSQIATYKTTFAILLVIFIGVQLLGIMGGFFYSLVGEESAKASRYIRGFNNAREFSNHYRMLRDKVACDAQARLGILQALVEDRHGTPGSKQAGRPRATFAQYLHEEREQDCRERIEKELASEREKDLELKREQARQRSEREIRGDAVAVAPFRVVQPSASALIEEKPVSISPSVATIVEGAPASIFVGEARMIAGLGDLTGWADDELADIAAELGLPFERLRRKQLMQKQIAKAKRGKPSGRT